MKRLTMLMNPRLPPVEKFSRTLPYESEWLLGSKWSVDCRGWCFTDVQLWNLVDTFVHCNGRKDNCHESFVCSFGLIDAQAEHEAQAGEKPWAEWNISSYLVVVTVNFPFHAVPFCPSKVDSHWKIHIL